MTLLFRDYAFLLCIKRETVLNVAIRRFSLCHVLLQCICVISIILKIDALIINKLGIFIFYKAFKNKEKQVFQFQFS